MSQDIQEMYDQLRTAIDEIDVKLDSLTDAASAGKRKIVNDLMEKNSEIVTKVVDNFVPQLENLDEETLVGVYRGIVSKLSAAFDERTKQIVDKLVEAAPKSAPLITAEEAEVLSKQRSELYQGIKMVVTLNEKFGNNPLEMPKSRRGAAPGVKRGPRALNLMVWSIDDVVLDPQPSLKDLAESLGFESTKDMRAAMKEQGIDTTNPENGELTFTAADGKVLFGYIPTEDDDEENGAEEAEEAAETETE